MKKFELVFLGALIGVLAGIAIGTYVTMKRFEPERLAWKESQYFRVEVSQKIGQADELVEKLCDAVEQIEKAIGPLDVFIKLYGEDRTVAIGALKPKPSKAD
jgi:hypothetical protein